MEISEKIVISISGTKFELDTEILTKFSETRLGKAVSDLKRDSNGDYLKDHQSPQFNLDFSRPLSSFEVILAYYQTGQLHIPNHVCPKAFKLELDFWEIPHTALEKCCLYKFAAAMSEYETMDKFRNALPCSNSEKLCIAGNDTEVKRIQNRTWRIIDNRESTKLAKIYLVISTMFMVESVFSLAFSTLPVFRSELSNCHLREYMEKNDLLDPAALDFIDSIPCEYLTVKHIQDFVEFWGYFLDFGEFANNLTDTITGDIEKPPSSDTVNALKNLKLPSKNHNAFTYIEYICVAFFSIELFLRLFTCPNIWNYLCQILNDIEIVILLAAYLNIAITEYSFEHKYGSKGVLILQYFQMFRILRLFRVMSNVTPMRVLSHALKSGYKDLLVLLMYLFIGVILFSNFLYFAEESSNIPSIPDAWWWAVITMTTVGYGDIVPKTPIGRLIGAVCAITGVVLLALVIPVFVNTFISFYQFASLYGQLNEQPETIAEPEKAPQNKHSSVVMPLKNDNITVVRSNSE